MKPSSRGVQVAVAMGLMNVATYAFTMVAARLLGPRPYGAFAAFMAVLLVFGVAQLGLQATAARRIAAEPEHTTTVRHTILRVTQLSALALGVVLLAVTPLLDRALRLEDLRVAALVALTVAPMTLLGGQQGVLQGERRWTALAWSYAANGIPRLAVGGVLIALQPTVLVAALAVALTSWVPVGVAWWALRLDERSAPEGAAHGVAAVLRELLHNSQALLAFFALSNVDILVARNQLDAHFAGLYAAGVILVKAVLFLPQFVVVLAFPSLSTTTERRRALVAGLGLVGAVGAICTLGAWLLGDLALVFVGGTAYADIEPRLWLFAVLGTELAMLQLLVYSVLARQSHRATLLAWVALVAVAVLGSRADSWQSLLGIVVAVDGVLLVALLAITAWRERTRSATR